MKNIIVILLLFFAGLCLTAFAAQLIAALNIGDERSLLLCQSAIQCVLAFALPAWVAGRFITKDKPAKFLEIDSPVNWRNISGVIILFVISLPFLNATVDWNASLHLPDSMSAVENLLREWETNGEVTTQKILATTSIGGLISGVLIIGVLTGICEELFFRGALQNGLRLSGLSVGVSVWLAAFVFSTLHFQFFGFVPRLLMGAMFGYLLVWSRSLWVSAMAHSLNNSMVVIVYWLSQKGYFGEHDFANIGVSNGQFPILALGSAASICIFLYLFRNYFFKNGKEDRRSDISRHN
ncbi:MAG: CPBP family intramembrane metalloprotease [Bacteroidales bacterium]|nr:CPBP family intramembrane metalloprotease [Bacteroidales bacterium]